MTLEKYSLPKRTQTKSREESKPGSILRIIRIVDACALSVLSVLSVA